MICSSSARGSVVVDWWRLENTARDDRDAGRGGAGTREQKGHIKDGCFFEPGNRLKRLA